MKRPLIAVALLASVACLASAGEIVGGCDTALQISRGCAGYAGLDIPAWKIRGQYEGAGAAVRSNGGGTLLEIYLSGADSDVTETVMFEPAGDQGLSRLIRVYDAMMFLRVKDNKGKISRVKVGSPREQILRLFPEARTESGEEGYNVLIVDRDGLEFEMDRTTGRTVEAIVVRKPS